MVDFFHSICGIPSTSLPEPYAAPASRSVQLLLHFHLVEFLFLVALYLATSLLVGLLYGAMLPMLPNRPILLGGVIAPLIWTGLLYHIIGYVNPLLDERINWWWFTGSQVAFGIVAGLVVVRQNKVWTSENLPLAMRAGLEAPGVMHERDDEDARP
jgi:MFS family permease